MSGHQSEEPPLLSTGRTGTGWRPPASTQHPFFSLFVCLSEHREDWGKGTTNGGLKKMDLQDE